MKGVRICKKCLDDLQNGASAPNVEQFDPDNTLRDILKFCVPNMNLHNLSSLSLCSACVEILKSLEEHVTRCTNVEDIHVGKIPEDIDDFVKYCMQSFAISTETEKQYAERNEEEKAIMNISQPTKNYRKKCVQRKRRTRKRISERQKKRTLRRHLSLDSLLTCQEKKRVKMPMLCGHYLNSMLNSEIRENPSCKFE